jgi:CCR4-NOT transcriptional complex subunit CAF120
MFEHATLQEAYTGALIAGKGKALNNINIIMERSKLRSEDWARVRFGAGTPWRRCWCVITPPDEKEVQKLQKQLNKKKSAYDRSRPPILKGDIKFYDTKKTKKVRPIATITDAYSAFAIYPQSKPLIDASTLVKVEGSITIHSNPPSTTEGFVFVMPEVHPAVTGFEMMLRWLFPVFDTFGLYGRPGRLVADTSDPQSLMFAMPKHRRYGYLEILDVTGLIVEQGSANWRESDWRRKMKELTKKRMTAIENGSRTNSRYSSRRSTRNSFGPSRSRIQFDDAASIKSSPSVSWGQTPGMDGPQAGIPRTDSAPPGVAFTPPRQNSMPHHRSVSETHGLDRYQHQNSAANYDGAYDKGPTPPPHSIGVSTGREGSGLRYMSEMASTPERVSSEDDQAARTTPIRELQELQATTTPEPVSAPPAFAHAPGSLPASKPYHSPELRRANSRMSTATLSQLAGAGGVAAAAYHAEPRTSEDQRRQNVGRVSEERGQRGVDPSAANTHEFRANQRGLNEGLVAASNPRFSFENSSPSRPLDFDSRQTPQYPTTSSNSIPPNPEPPTGYPVSQSSDNRGNAPNSRTYEPPHIFPSPEPNQNIRSQQGHVSQQSADSSHSATAPTRIKTSQSITRKPLPARQASVQTPNSVETPSSTGSLGQHVIDQAAFDMIGRRETTKTLHPESQMQRQKSGASSVYEDNASTDSPDYASTTRPSIDTQKSVERPRAGVKKTVGNPDAESSQHSDLQDIRSSIHIDFGPTLNYASDRLPQQQSPARGQSPGPAQGFGGDRHGSPARGVSPGPNYPTDRVQQRSPRPDSSGQSRSPNRHSYTPENVHYRNVSAESRTLAWQPGMALGMGGNPSGQQQSITPEQFVQQRAAAPPLYAHQRQASGNTLGRNTPTPPLVRNRSSELLALQGHSRNSSADLLQRPSSRGASTALGPSGSGDITSKLSAREQEHIARVTGQPLINMAHNNKQGAPGAGLVGAISAREQEKQQMKQGINSQAVQQAIAQRQSQMYQQYPEQNAGGNRLSQYGMSQYTQSQFPLQPQNQQAWVSPAANVFAQGGGWANPSPGYAAPQDQGRQSPSLYPAQQQYFPPQQQGGRGRGNPGGYHGHGF